MSQEVSPTTLGNMLSCKDVMRVLRDTRGTAFSSVGELCRSMLSEARLFQSVVLAGLVKDEYCYTEYVSPPLATLYAKGDEEWENTMLEVLGMDNTSVSLQEELELSSMEVSTNP